MGLKFDFLFQRSLDRGGRILARSLTTPAIWIFQNVLKNWNEYIHPTKTSYKVKMTDRRRINGPSGGTSAPVFSKYLIKDSKDLDRPTRSRAPNVLRKMCTYQENTAIQTNQLTIHSPKDRSHSLGVRFRISRT